MSVDFVIVVIYVIDAGVKVMCRILDLDALRGNCGDWLFVSLKISYGLEVAWSGVSCGVCNWGLFKYGVHIQELSYSPISPNKFHISKLIQGYIS